MDFQLYCKCEAKLTGLWGKNPAYGRQSISRPMRIVAPMPQEGGPRQNQQKKLFFARRFQTTSRQKCSNVRPLLSITFPQGFRISKNIGRLSNYALVLFCPWLSLFCPWLHLFVPLFVGQEDSVAALCSPSLTMVEVGATVQIPGIKGGLLLINMVTMS